MCVRVMCVYVLCVCTCYVCVHAVCVVCMYIHVRIHVCVHLSVCGTCAHAYQLVAADGKPC